MKGFTFDLQRFDEEITAENAIAQIGSTYYATLQDAVNAVGDDETITLLKDATGNGVQVASGKNFTIDFNGKTYDVDGTTVGSAGTETQAFQLLRDSTITFKDGTITSTKALMLVQNYSNLTLDNMTLDGTQLQGDDPYTLSNNNGTTVIKDSTIKAASGGHAFDVCYYSSYPSVSVTVEGNSLIDGKIELGQTAGRGYANAQFIVNGGTFTGEMTYWNVSATEAKEHSTINGGQFKVANETLGITAEVTDAEGSYFTTQTLAQELDGYVTATIDGETKYYATEDLAAASTADCVAKIGDSYFTTLQKAVDAVGTGETITLLDNAKGSGVKVASGKDFTLDFGGYTYTVSGTVGSPNTVTNGFQLLKDSNITFKNGTIAAGAYSSNNPLLRLIQNYSNLTLEDMDIDGSGLLVDSEDHKLVAVVDNVITTVSTNNGTLNIIGTTSIETIDTRYYKSDGEIVATTSGNALAVGYAAQSYPNGAQVNIDTKGEIAGISFGTWGQGETEFNSSLTIENGTIGDITIDEDALALGALDNITIDGGTFFGNTAIKPGATLLVTGDNNLVVVKGWNQTAEKTFTYVAAPEEDDSHKGTELFTVSGVTSTDDIRIDDTNKVAAIPKGATFTALDEDYKSVEVSYSGTTATVTTTEDGIEITETLLADTVTKISAAGNVKTVYISGDEKVTSIVGGAKDDTLAGAGDKVTLTGGAGNDVFIYDAGKFTITDYGDGADKISVDEAPTSFAFSGKNLVLTFDEGNTLTVNGAKGKAVTFTDGEEETVRTYLENGAINDGGKVTLDETFKGSSYNISKVNDVTQVDASALENEIKIIGNNEGNTLTSGAGNDTLTGGTSADELTGNDGADTFVYNGGADKITDYESEDTVKLAKNFTIKSATFGEEDVTLTLNGTGNSITLDDAADKTITVRNASNKILKYGKDFTAQDKSVTLNASAKSFDASTEEWATLVTLDGSAASAVELTGNAKNNLFIGTKGADTFVHTAGKDVIGNYDAKDVVKVDDFGEITAAKFNSSKVVLTVGSGALTFNNKPAEINLVDDEEKTATLTEAGIVTADGIQLFNGTKRYDGTATNVDASNVKNAITIAGGAANQTFTGTAGKTVYTFDGTKSMTIDNYASGDKISVKGSVTNVAVDDDTKNVTLTVDGTGSIVLTGAAAQTINLHDDSNKAGKYTARLYPQTGVTADKATPTAVTLSSAVDNYAAPSTVTQITYTGGAVTVTDFDTSTGKINYGDLTITDVTATQLIFGKDNTLTLADHNSETKVQLASLNEKGKTVNSIVWLGDHALYDDTPAKATTVSVTSGDKDNKYTAPDKIQSVAVIGSDKIFITGNALNNTLTANDAGDTLDGGAGTDVLIGGNGADVFIHDKVTGTTTINNYTTTDTISLGKDLQVVGSAYSPGSKNGKLTLTVKGTDSSEIVIKSDDFTKTASPTYGAITIGGKETSFGKNAIYSDGNVELLPAFSGKFIATSSSKVDGSNVTEKLTLQGSAGNDTLIGGAGNNTLAGGTGDDSLIGGGKDTFTYASGDGKDRISNFGYNDDKLKVSTQNLITGISANTGNLTFTMSDGGSVTLEDIKGDFVIKANSTLYWFDEDKLITAATKTDDMKTILNDTTGSYAVVQLDYGTNLVSDGIASKVSDATFSANTFKK